MKYDYLLKYSEGKDLGSFTIKSIARPEAQSYVIHDDKNKTRLLCLDLE
tara:strand:+ start:422 stop:568 length:147 start_codon:yes stop_codon:yes gene_type:complete